MTSPSNGVFSWFVDPAHCNRFEFQLGHLKKEDGSFHMSQFEGQKVPTNYIFYKDTVTEEIRKAQPPETLSRHLRILALGTPIFFVGKVASYIVRLTAITAEIFFKTFCDVYAKDQEESSPRVFTQKLKEHADEKKEGAKEIFKDLGLACLYVVPMEVAAIKGGFNSEPLRMHAIFTYMERRWNKELEGSWEKVKDCVTTLLETQSFEASWEKLTGLMDRALYLYPTGSPLNPDRVELKEEVFDTYEDLCNASRKALNTKEESPEMEDGPSAAASSSSSSSSDAASSSSSGDDSPL